MPELEHHIHSCIAPKLYEDNELWNLLKAGDEQAFEMIYRRNVRNLYREISKRIDDLCVVEDLVQDIFLDLWEKRAAYQIRKEIYPYLYGMAMHRVLNYYRQNKMKPRSVEIWENMPAEAVTSMTHPEAFRQTQLEEMESLLDRAVASLPVRMLQVYELRYEKDMSVSEIATALSTSPNTVHNQLKSIRQRIGKALKQTSYLFLLTAFYL